MKIEKITYYVDVENTSTRNYADLRDLLALFQSIANDNNIVINLNTDTLSYVISIITSLISTVKLLEAEETIKITNISLYKLLAKHKKQSKKRKDKIQLGADLFEEIFAEDDDEGESPEEAIEETPK